MRKRLGVITLVAIVGLGITALPGMLPEQGGGGQSASARVDTFEPETVSAEGLPIYVVTMEDLRYEDGTAALVFAHLCTGPDISRTEVEAIVSDYLERLESPTHASIRIVAPQKPSLVTAETCTGRTLPRFEASAESGSLVLDNLDDQQ